MSNGARSYQEKALGDDKKNVGWAVFFYPSILMMGKTGVSPVLPIISAYEKCFIRAFPLPSANILFIVNADNPIAINA